MDSKNELTTVSKSDSYLTPWRAPFWTAAASDIDNQFTRRLDLLNTSRSPRIPLKILKYISQDVCDVPANF